MNQYRIPSNLSPERQLLEEIKRRRNHERAELLQGLSGLTLLGFCEQCGREIYEGEMDDGQCRACVQLKSIQTTQLQQLHRLLDQYRDEALTRGTLLANALFDSLPLQTPKSSKAKRKAGGKRLSVSQDESLMMNQTSHTCYHNEKESSRNEYQSPELFCHIKKCTDKYAFHEMLVCDVCQRGFHASCCVPPLHYHLAIRHPWLCTSDKECSVCHTMERESSMLLCDGCDRSFHQWCSVPPVKQVPDDEWFCSDCKICQICKQDLTPDEIKSPHTFGSNNARICPNCLSKQPQSKLRLCCVCHEIKEPHQGTCKCSGCDEEVHMECCIPGPSFSRWCLECLGVNNEEEDWMSATESEKQLGHDAVRLRKRSTPVSREIVREDDGACRE